MSKLILEVQGMTCNHCVKSVKNAVSGLAGVVNVDVTLADGKVEVEVNNAATTAELVAQTIEDQGFTVVNS